MKLTLSNIKELKRNSDSPLTKRVCNYVIGRWGDYNDKKYIFTDVLHNGCCSGVVSELIYYYDTVRFYNSFTTTTRCDFISNTAKRSTRCFTTS